MTKNPIDALKRADRTLIGALALILVTASAAWAYVPHTDRTAPVAQTPATVAVTLNVAPADTPVPTARPQVLPATVRIISAPTQDQVSSVQAVIDNPQTQCLAEAMYYEARGEGARGEKAIAEVVFNRIRSGLYPRSVCGVVNEGAGIEGGCQFSFTCNGQTIADKSRHDWVRARVLAAAIIAGVIKLDGETEGAISYHASYVDPDWGNMVRTVQIGNHIFYRRAGRRWITRGA
jgi:spore germination cell wall hydrolase CwlJ-like protein